MSAAGAPRCAGCGALPSELAEYVEAARDVGMSAEQYVRQEEGTYNRASGHFLCTRCYAEHGMPAAPGGWVAP